ncbi:Splicing factor 3b subunit 4 [Zostera marina]|uniref:Splicing factor 3b subunit 4 n=1 Tax=Zostera marina TaxID=29655 RepID=A0A0K9PB79_ZOSMR|nr:Splicing factor 3b subunit 4 [Zostera marina]
MSRNPSCTIYIGNLDEKVTERVLYDILIEAGRIVDLYLPQDKDSGHHKGFAFAEYETEEIANYALRLFSGVVYLCNKLVKFGMSGQDRSSQRKPTPNRNLHSTF